MVEVEGQQLLQSTSHSNLRDSVPQLIVFCFIVNLSSSLYASVVSGSGDCQHWENMMVRRRNDEGSTVVDDGTSLTRGAKKDIGDYGSRRGRRENDWESADVEVEDSEAGGEWEQAEEEEMDAEVVGFVEEEEEEEDDDDDDDTVDADEACRGFVEDVLVRERALDSSKGRSCVVEGLFGAVEDWDEADAAFIEVCYARVKTVVEVMEGKMDDRGIQERGCHLMGAIAGRRPGLVRWMAEAGCAKAVLDSMKTWDSAPKVQERALGALRAFTVVDEMRKAVMCSGGVQQVMTAMKQHPESARVQDRGATVLANVSFGCPHRKRKIGQAGGLKQIVSAMTSHPNDQDIQLRGALAIRNLTYHCQVNQYLAGREGAVEVVSRALLAFPDYCPLRYQAIVALTNLSVDDKANRQRILDFGHNADPRKVEKKTALRGIVRTMKEEKGNPFLLEHGLALLYHLSTKQPDAQERIGDLGGVDLALDAIERNIDVTSLVTKGCSLVRVLCFTQQNRDRVSANLGALISVIKKHMARTELAADAIAALSNTTFNHDINRTIVAQKGGIEAVIRTMDKTPDNIPLQDQGCRALRTMIEGSVENTILVCELKGIEAIATALSMTSTCDTKEKRIAQQEGIYLLGDMAKLSPAVLRSMVEASVADFIENSLAKIEKKSHREFHSVGDELLEQIHACEEENRMNGGSESSAFPSHDPLPTRKSSAGFSSGMFSSMRGNAGGKLRLKERLEQSFHLGSASKRHNGKKQRTNERRKRRPFGLRRFFGT